MKLHGRNQLEALFGIDEQTDKWLRSWLSEMRHANWKQTKDVLLQFPQAKGVEHNVFLFRVGLQEVWIEVLLCFSSAIAIVTDLKRTN